MTMRVAIVFAAALVAAGCAQYSMPAATPAAAADLSAASDAEWHRHVGQTVSLRGSFSLRGKVGPFILVSERPVYLVSHGAFSWGERYERMEGRHVQVTGILRFAHYPEASPDSLPVSRPSDHFYFDAASASVELSQK